MIVWSEWEIVRHQVTLCGVVLDGGGKRLPNARVSIEDGPKAYQAKRTAVASAVPARPIISLEREMNEELEESFETRTTRPDGSFYFLDLPSGKYALKANDRLGGSDEKTATISRRKDGTIGMAKLQFTLEK